MERDESDAVVRAFAEFMRECVHRVRTEEHDGPWLGETLAEHLGTDPRELPIVELAVSSHQFVNLDIAVQALMDAAGGGSTVGVGGGDQRHHASFADLVQVNYWGRTPVAAVERTDLPVGPDAHRQVVSFGVRMLRFDGEPVAVLQRSARAGHDGPGSR